MIRKKHIAKVFEQKFSFLDQKMLEKYFEDKKLNEETKIVIKEQWEKFEPDSNSQLNLDHVFYKLYYTLKNKKDSPGKSKNLFIRISRIAAVLVIGILISTTIYYYNSNKSNNKIPSQIEFISYGGFRSLFKLPDGTCGWLGYDSELKYHLDDKRQRIVELNGLAYFNVAHQQEQPFIVKTPKNLDIKVLGTRFNVSSYAEDNFCEIVLEEGKVNLSANNSDIGEMLPNERIVYHSGNNTVEKSNVVAADYVAWKDGKLILNDNSLEEACLKLSKFYNVDFELQTTEIESQKIRLILENETLDDALKLLTMIAPVKYQIRGREVLDNNSYSKKKIIIKNK